MKCKVMAVVTVVTLMMPVVALAGPKSNGAVGTGPGGYGSSYAGSGLGGPGGRGR